MTVLRSVVVIHEFRLTLARIVAGHHHGGLEVAYFLRGQADWQAFDVGWLIDGAEVRRERRGRLDHALIERQPHALIERDGGDYPASVAVSGHESPCRYR